MSTVAAKPSSVDRDDERIPRGVARGGGLPFAEDLFNFAQGKAHRLPLLDEGERIDGLARINAIVVTGAPAHRAI